MPVVAVGETLIPAESGLPALTEEQKAIVSRVKVGESVKVLALAGTGKTSTLVAIARACPDRRMLYVAFNKSVQTEAERRFPGNVEARTAHSLAWQSVGKQFARERLLRNLFALKRGLLPALKPVFDQAGIAEHGRAGYVYATLDAIEAFHRSAAPELDAAIVGKQPDGRKPELVLELARAAWAAMSDRAGAAPLTDSTYLKLWQLSKPALRREMILLDECQPTGTVVLVRSGEREGRCDRTPFQPVPIEELHEGARVLSYDQHGMIFRKAGSLVRGVSVRPFDGRLVVVSASGLRSRYTPNHHCIVKIGAAFNGKTLVYLMRRGPRWRVGVTSAYHGRRRFASGVRGRLHEEQGDEMWVLGAFDRKQDALLEEEFISARYGLPQMGFASRGERRYNQSAIDAFWSRFDQEALCAAADRCLADYGRDARFPLLQNDGKYLLYNRAMVLRACNLMDGMQVLDARGGATGSGKVTATCSSWAPIAVSREAYIGSVYSLDVEPDHTYVADGIATHNCQDLDPIMLDVMQRQKAQFVAVGDASQQIYEWRGAVNALNSFDYPALPLTQSWRFGPSVAHVANRILAAKGERLRVKGAPGVEDHVCSVPEATPDVVLARTNTGLVGEALTLCDSGKTIAVVGGLAQLVKQIEAAHELWRRGRTGHPAFSIFDNWQELQEASETEQGQSYRPFVQLVLTHRASVPDVCARLLDSERPEGEADVLLCTIHKFKGREGAHVRLASDLRAFVEEDLSGTYTLSVPEANLGYVAVTRAKRVLELGAYADALEFSCRHSPAAVPLEIAPEPAAVPARAEPVMYGMRQMVEDRARLSIAGPSSWDAQLLAKGDPRPDLADDSVLWGTFLGIVYEREPSLFGTLHGMRGCGLRLERTRAGGYRLAPTIDPSGKVGWYWDRHSWEIDRDGYLTPHRDAVVRLLEALKLATAPELAAVS